MSLMVPDEGNDSRNQKPWLLGSVTLAASLRPSTCLLLPIIGISSQRALPFTASGIRVTKENAPAVRHRIEPRFHLEKRQNQGQEWGQLSMATDPSLLVLLQKDSIPSSQGKDVAVGLDRCLVMHTPKQNNRAHVESETEKDIPTQGGKSSTGCEDPTSLSKEVFRPKAPCHVT